MAEGTIKKLMDKGFGFINTGGAKDLFFHSTSLEGARFDELYDHSRCGGLEESARAKGG